MGSVTDLYALGLVGTTREEIDKKSMAAFIKSKDTSNKRSKKTDVVIKSIQEVVTEKKNDPNRRKFVSGVISLDMQYAVRDSEGNIIQMGDPEGIHILYSKTSQGKTITMMTKAAQMQKNGLRGLLIFSEQEAAEELENLCRMAGIDMENIHVAFATEMEAIFTTLEQAIGSHKGADKDNYYDFIIIDSFDTLKNAAEVKKGSAEDDMMLAARRSSRFLRINHEDICQKGIRLYVIFQFRNSMDAGTEYSIENYTGGNAWKHYAKSIGYVKRHSGRGVRRSDGDYLKASNSENKTGVSKKGFIISIKLMKTKISGAIEGSTSYYDFYHMKGIDKLGTAFEMAIKEGLIEKSGPSYLIPNGTDEPTKVMGIDNAKELFKNTEELQLAVTNALLNTYRYHNIQTDITPILDNVEEVTEEESIGEDEE